MEDEGDYFSDELLQNDLENEDSGNSSYLDDSDIDPTYDPELPGTSGQFPVNVSRPISSLDSDWE